MAITATLPSTASPAAAAAGVAGTTLAGNFDTFLKLLTTQMQNQDPTNPLDTNQFTSQLVQFAGVEQQIKANTNLTTLIDLSRASSLYQASAMIGHQVGVESTQLALQGGSAGLRIPLAASQSVQVTISSTSGVPLYSTAIDGQRGDNDWTWNGQSDSGATLPDGIYNVKVTTGTGGEIGFTVTGTVTAVGAGATAPTVALGPLALPISAIRSVIR